MTTVQAMWFRADEHRRRRRARLSGVHADGRPQHRGSLTRGSLIRPRPKHFLSALSRLAEAADRADNTRTMRRLQVVPQELPLHPQDEVECRRCEVHCDKVVHPSACVERACPFLYSFVELGRTYVGCMQKVFNVEIDLALMLEAEDHGGIRSGAHEPAAAADVPRRGRELLRGTRGRARVRQPGVPRAPARRAELPDLRAGQAERLTALASLRALSARSRHRRVRSAPDEVLAPERGEGLTPRRVSGRT